MIKNTAKRIYLVLIRVILLYAPIITLIVSVLQQSSKSRAKWGGFTGKMVRGTVPESGFHYERTLHDPDHRIAYLH